MQKFIKFYEDVNIDDYYHLYRIYSGNNELEIKERIIEDLKDSWMNSVNHIPQALNASASLEDIQNIMIDIVKINDGENYYDLYLGVADDLNDVISFYGQYEEKKNEETYAGVDFYAYGDDAINLENMLPYLFSLQSEYEIYFSDKVIQKLKSIIG